MTVMEGPLTAATVVSQRYGREAVHVNAREEHLVVFKLADEFFGVDIAEVWEINEVQAITRVPQAPPFVEGVINLRGQITPVMDLRKRLGLPGQAHNRETRIMVVQVNQQRLGLVVDSVNEVIKVPASAIEPPSPLVTSVHDGFLRAIAKLEDRLIILFDLTQLLTIQEENQLARMHNG
jgi:purine-binding chemotaxis protein CheW